MKVQQPRLLPRRTKAALRLSLSTQLKGKTRRIGSDIARGDRAYTCRVVGNQEVGELVDIDVKSSMSADDFVALIYKGGNKHVRNEREGAVQSFTRKAWLRSLQGIEKPLTQGAKFLRIDFANNIVRSRAKFSEQLEVVSTVRFRHKIDMRRYQRAQNCVERWRLVAGRFLACLQVTKAFRAYLVKEFRNGGDEQSAFGSEVIMDRRHVDARLTRDLACRHPVVAVACKVPDGDRQDCVASTCAGLVDFSVLGGGLASLAGFSVVQGAYLSVGVACDR